MNNLEKLEAGIAGLNTIKFRAVLGKTQGKANVCPAKSKTTGRLFGVKLMSEDERKVTQYVVTEETNLDISDGFELNMDDEIDRINWEWLKYLPELVPSLEDSYETPLALFYIENLQKDTQDRVKKRNIKKTAFKYVTEASLPKKKDVCRIMGTDVSYMSELDLEDYLGELCDSTPAKVVSAFEDKLIKVKLFLYALLDKKIVQKDVDGVYVWGSHILGVNEKSALQWLQISDNAHYIKRLHEEVYPKPELKQHEGHGEIALPKAAVTPIPTPVASDDGTAELDKSYASSDLVDESAEEFTDQITTQLAREKYEQLLGKKPGNMKVETMLAKITEAEKTGI